MESLKMLLIQEMGSYRFQIWPSGFCQELHTVGWKVLSFPEAEVHGKA